MNKRDAKVSHGNGVNTFANLLRDPIYNVYTGNKIMNTTPDVLAQVKRRRPDRGLVESKQIPLKNIYNRPHQVMPSLLPG